MTPTSATFSIVETVKFGTDIFTTTSTFSGIMTGDSELLPFGATIKFTQVFEEFVIVSIKGICGAICCKLLRYNSCPVSCVFTIGDSYSYTITLTVVPDATTVTTTTTTETVTIM